MFVRIPNSINSKSKTKVTIIQKWNGVRSPINNEIIIRFKKVFMQRQIEDIMIDKKFLK